MQRKGDSLNIHAKSTGLKINTAKTNTKFLTIMGKSGTRCQQFHPFGKVVEDVSNFIYLGATVSNTGGTIEDIRSRLGH